MALGPQALTAISSGFPSLSPQVSSEDGGSRRGSWPERHVLLLLVKNSRWDPVLEPGIPCRPSGCGWVWLEEGQLSQATGTFSFN